MNLLRIVYISRMSLDGRSTPDEVAEILAASRRNNGRCGVTGALLVGPSGFAQVLEGPAERVGDTFERIQCDDRHDEVTVLSLGPVEGRQFGAWSMACCDGAEALIQAGVSLADLAAAGAEGAQPTLDLLQRAMRGDHVRTRTFGTASLAHFA